MSSETQNKTPELLQEIVYEPTTKDNNLIPLQAKPAMSSNRPNYFLYFTTFIVNLIAFSAGIPFGWPSPVIPKLKTNSPETNPLTYSISSTEESWIAAFLCLGGILGATFSGWLADKIGRKRTLLAITYPIFFGYISLAFARRIEIFYVCRFVLGACVSSTLTVLPMYLSEIAEDHNRGTLGCIMGVFIASGILFAYVVGPYVSICNFCLLAGFPQVILVPIFTWGIPESPHFLILSGKNEEGEYSLAKFRGKSRDSVQKEMLEIVQMLKDQSQGTFCDLLRSKSLRKGLMLTLSIITIQQFAGINAVLAYMQIIFDAAGGTIPSEISTIIVGITKVLSTIVTSVLVDKLGRRKLLLASTLGTFISLTSLGAYFYLKNNDFQVDLISWLPVTSLVVYIISFNIGLGPLPWALMAELFPSNVKSKAATLTSFVCFIGAFLITLFFPYVAEILGMAQSFWIFALVCITSFVFIYIVLPETKGKSLNEILRLLGDEIKF